MTSINTNVSALVAQTNLRSANSMSASSIGRLSSGDSIVRAADDVAGLSIGTVLNVNVNTLRTALTNANQANSLLQVADGGLSNLTDILTRQKALATQATSGTLSSAERGFLNQEFQNLSQEIDRLVENTKFNQVTLLDGSLTGEEGNTLVQTNAQAILAGANAANVTSTFVMDFFEDGAIITGGAAGNIQFLEEDLVTVYAADDFGTLPSSVVGDLGKFQVSNATYNVSADISVQLGGVELTGTFADGATNVIMSDASGTVNVQFFLAGGATNIANQADVINLNDALNADYDGASLHGVYNVAGWQPDGTYLDGATAQPIIRTNDLSDMSIKNFQAVTVATGANVLSVEVGGETFISAAIANDPTAAPIEFASGDKTLTIDLAGMTITPDIFTNETDLDSFLDALNTAFTNSQGALNFQTGAATDDAISVAIGRSDTTALGVDGLDITTLAGAQQAGSVLDSAINRITSIRADVGALQSRFDFASSNLETSIQNQEAATSVFLDADISAESSSFASAQVSLQASISVLAQANQLPQNLLKLIG